MEPILMSAISPFNAGFSNGPTTVDAQEDVTALLDALNDADCQVILQATNDETLTASELAETCDMPLSTTYRKLEMLTDAGLVSKGTRIRKSGKHTSEFSRTVDDVVVSVDSDTGISLEITRMETAEQTPFSQAAGGI